MSHLKEATVRVRFAPSPTGYLHIGGLRTALFNFLFARRHQGAFLIRVEDTDRERSRPEYTEAQLAALAWCGLTPFGPEPGDSELLFQSERTAEYQLVAERLIATGCAYRCYCTQAEMQARARTAGYAGVTEAGAEYFFYDGTCRDRPESIDAPSVIRMRVSRDQATITIPDLIHGQLSVPVATIDDFVLIRSNGMPMYNFAVVVDDIAMRITHVIRGDDHIINTPRQYSIYRALGVPLPYFAHIPLIVGHDGKKLSKRDAATAVDEYRIQGFLPEALTNYLVRLGWAHGDTEIIGHDELIALFALEDIGSKAATFDIDKLLWLNGVYLQKRDSKELLNYIATIPENREYSYSAWLGAVQDYWSECPRMLWYALDLYKTRAKTIRELCELIAELITPALPREEAMARGMVVREIYGTDMVHVDEREDILKVIAHFCSQLRRASSGIHSYEEVSALVKRHLTEAIADVNKSRISQNIKLREIRFGDCAPLLRAALAGRKGAAGSAEIHPIPAPGLYDLMVLLGLDETIKRIEYALARVAR